MTKFMIRSAVRTASRAPLIGQVYRTIVAVSNRVVSIDRSIKRSLPVERGALDAAAEAAGLNELVVRNGPFAGMRYARPLPEGSIFFPKLLGSYEAELQAHFERVIGTDYSAIVDVGCADGYFAVGLAMRMP